MKLGPVIPILRMYDEAATRAFYLNYLAFSVDFTHRFAPELPLYMQVSRDACRLHLSQHHGDCTPGSAVRIACADVEALHAELIAKNYHQLRPGLEAPPWGGTELALLDPAGNRLVFVEAPPKG